MGAALLSMRGQPDIYADTGGWTRVAALQDEWQLNVLRAAFIHAEIPFKTENLDGAVALLTPAEYAVEAELARMRVEEALIRPPASDDPPPASAGEKTPPPSVIPMKTEILTPVQTVAADPSLGEIVYLEGYGYELRVGPEPFYAVRESDWEEFLDISAQRHEFAMLLENEYERLNAHLRGAKRFPQFTRLVETAYKGADADDNPADFLRAAGWTLAAAALLAGLTALARWIAS